MAIPHAGSGVPVDLISPGETPGEAQSVALVKNPRFQVIRLSLPADREVCHEHEVDGPITMQCLSGRAEMEAEGTTHDLSAGRWLYLEGGVPHKLRGIEDSFVLLTIMFPKSS